jgi:hypothetical protein
MALNYLPFARREVINVPAAISGGKVTTGGFAVTDIARMSSGSTRRAILQDVIINLATENFDLTLPDGHPLRIRIGIDGRNYMTEDLYDYRVFMDRAHPLAATWDWSCGKRTPYRLYPGQSMKVWMDMSRLALDPQSGAYCDIPLAVMFNGLQVAHGSPIGTKDGEPIILYNRDHPRDRNDTGLIMLRETTRLNCPKESPIDLYSVTIPECVLGEFLLNTITSFQTVYIEDGNERPFWDSRLFTGIVDQPASAISFGYGGVQVDPDETLRIDLENADPTMTNTIAVWVTYRGVLEVDDGR